MRRYFTEILSLFCHICLHLQRKENTMFLFHGWCERLKTSYNSKLMLDAVQAWKWITKKEESVDESETSGRHWLSSARNQILNTMTRVHWFPTGFSFIYLFPGSSEPRPHPLSCINKKKQKKNAALPLLCCQAYTCECMSERKSTKLSLITTLMQDQGSC